MYCRTWQAISMTRCYARLWLSSMTTTARKTYSLRCQHKPRLVALKIFRRSNWFPILCQIKKLQQLLGKLYRSLYADLAEDENSTMLGQVSETSSDEEYVEEQAQVSSVSENNLSSLSDGEGAFQVTQWQTDIVLSITNRQEISFENIRIGQGRLGILTEEHLSETRLNSVDSDVLGTKISPLMKARISKGV